MDTKITYTCTNAYSYITSLQVSTYYNTCVDSALELLKAENLLNLNINKVETI